MSRSLQSIHLYSTDPYQAPELRILDGYLYDLLVFIPSLSIYKLSLYNSIWFLYYNVVPI
jgi:hypothetical protein